MLSSQRRKGAKAQSCTLNTVTENYFTKLHEEDTKIHREKHNNIYLLLREPLSIFPSGELKGLFLLLLSFLTPFVHFVLYQTCFQLSIIDFYFS